MNLTEYNVTNTSNYYKHNGTRGIVVQKVPVPKYIYYYSLTKILKYPNIRKNYLVSTNVHFGIFLEKIPIIILIII